jgi:alkylation response protein AidB-like acyl-CoA dehydrogenase/putative sterol carrier protein
MRSIYFSEQHEMFRQQVRKFVETEIAPNADEWERVQRTPRSAWKRLGEEGLLGILFPEELGGGGADLFYALAFLEELPRSRMGGFCAAVSVQEFIATGALWKRGSRELKDRYLRPSITGDKVGAICITEPDTGSDVAAIRTAAVRDGDFWVINGAKTWITNGVHGDFYVIAAKTAPDAGAGGISLIAADASLPGIRTNKLKKLGWHSSDTAEIQFEDLRVPVPNLIGHENRGFYYLMETFAIERLVTAAISIGGSILALEETLAYMNSRKAFGRPIKSFQALRHRLADLSSELEAVRQLVYHTAWLVEQGEPAVRESSMSKLLSTELNKRLVDECLQFFGGYGFSEEYPMARFYRDARVSTIVAGTSEIMREIIAKTDIDGLSFAVPPDEPATEGEQAVSAAPPIRSTATPRPGKLQESVAELFQTVPQRLRAEKVEGWSTRFHFDFRGSSKWTVVIRDGACTVAEGLDGEASCVVSATEETYLAIETGKENAESAFLQGKVSVSNLNEMKKFLRAFRPLAR